MKLKNFLYTKIDDCTKIFKKSKRVKNYIKKQKETKTDMREQ